VSALAGEVAASRIHETLRIVLEREGIRLTDRPSLLERLFEWLGVGSVDIGSAIFWVWIVLGSVGFAFVLHFVLRTLAGAPAWRTRALARLGAGSSALDARRRRVQELRERARAAEAAGDLALALRLELFAIVVALGENGELEFRPAWTNRELCARGNPAPVLAERLLGVLDELDPLTWGPETAQPADLARLRALATELGAGEAA
jgi:hypothetical protein